jgi:hypothetical protein
MPIIQGGPPEWVWERTADPVKFEVAVATAREGHPVYELRVACGLDILRLQFFTAEEVRRLASLLAAAAPS